MSHTCTGRHVEFRNEFLEVGVVGQDVVPRFSDSIEHSVGQIEATVLQAQHQLGRSANEVKQNESRSGVMRAVEKPRLRHILG